MNVLLNLVCSLWVLLWTFSVSSSAYATSPAGPVMAYDGQLQPSGAYDGLPPSAFSYDFGAALFVDEKVYPTGTAIGLFAAFTNFLAAKTAPELLLDSNVVIGQGKQFLASGQNIVKASVSDVEIENLVRQGRISMPGAANQIPSVANSLNVDLRISVRGLLTPKLRGNFADGIIGATSIERGSILITRDKALIDAVNALGGAARTP